MVRFSRHSISGRPANGSRRCDLHCMQRRQVQHPRCIFQKKREQPAAQINIVIRFEYSAFVILFPLPPCDPFARFGHYLHQSLCARTRYGIRSKKTFRSYDRKYKAGVEIIFFARASNLCFIFHRIRKMSPQRFLEHSRERKRKRNAAARKNDPKPVSAAVLPTACIFACIFSFCSFFAIFSAPICIFISAGAFYASQDGCALFSAAFFAMFR